MKDSKKYYKDVEKSFSCNGKREKDFLSHFKLQILEYENDREICTYQHFVDKFGEPKEIFKSYYDTADSSYLSQKLDTKKIIRNCITIVCIVILCLGLWKAYLIYRDYNESTNQRITEVEILPPEEIE